MVLEIEMPGGAIIPKDGETLLAVPESSRTCMKEKAHAIYPEH